MATGTDITTHLDMKDCHSIHLMAVLLDQCARIIDAGARSIIAEGFQHAYYSLPSEGNCHR